MVFKSTKKCNMLENKLTVYRYRIIYNLICIVPVPTGRLLNGTNFFNVQGLAGSEKELASPKQDCASL